MKDKLYIPGLRRSRPGKYRCAYCGLRHPKGQRPKDWHKLLEESDHYFICPDCKTRPRTGPGLDEVGRFKFTPGGNDRPIGWIDLHKEKIRHENVKRKVT